MAASWIRSWSPSDRCCGVVSAPWRSPWNPDAVLTGSRYDIDLIVDEPLDQALVAAGLIDLTQQQVEDQLRPNLPLAPMGGGGLFKSVQAPADKVRKPGP